MRRTLVTALASYADRPLRVGVLRFLSGLSADELQFIADFYGACILESGDGGDAGLERKVEDFELARLDRHGLNEDRQHKMIVLHEYLSRCGARPAALSMSAGAS